MNIEKKKSKALQDALASIRKQHGLGAIMRLDDKAPEVDVISTGSLLINKALGVGGLPRGRIVEVYGPESSGKTTVTLHAIAEAQKAGGLCAFIDAEHAFDRSYAENLGVKTKDLLVSQPDCGEQALEIVDTLVRTGTLDLIVIDSVAALVPRAEIEGEMGDSHMGLQARLMSQALRKLTGVISKTKTVVVFINQLRQKIGVVYGNPEVTTGGNALKFYASVRLDIRRRQAIKVAGDLVGSMVQIKVVKNKLCAPFRDALVELYYGRGIDRHAEVLTLAENKEVIVRSGAWYSFGDQKLGQGREKTIAKLREDAKLLSAINQKLNGDDKLSIAA